MRMRFPATITEAANDQRSRQRISEAANAPAKPPSGQRSRPTISEAANDQRSRSTISEAVQRSAKPPTISEAAQRSAKPPTISEAANGRRSRPTVGGAAQRISEAASDQRSRQRISEAAQRSAKHVQKTTRATSTQIECSWRGSSDPRFTSRRAATSSLFQPSRSRDQRTAGCPARPCRSSARLDLQTSPHRLLCTGR
jgi:hypothetical protein